MGMFCSVILTVVVLTFGFIKMKDLIQAKNPLISSSEIQGQYLTPNDTMNLSKFPFAFYLEDFNTKEHKDDPSMVHYYGAII